MSWNYEKSSDRIREHLEKMGDIQVEPLSRNANLETLLTETRCRTINGSHVYVDVPNFDSLVTAAAGRESQLKHLVRALHVYQREVARIVENEKMFDGYHVHFQGSRLHALFYRPYEDKGLAMKAVMLGLVLRRFVRDVFNPAFSSVDDFIVTGGAALGNVIGTKNGMRSERELLFLGAPANYAAKILGSSGVFTITEFVYDALPDALRQVCVESDRVGPDGATLFELAAVSDDDLADLCEDYDIGWTPDASRERVANDIKAVALTDVAIEGATAEIDLDKLSVYKNKLIDAVSLFADVDGFTKYIDSAVSDEEKETALRVLHATRRELSRVVRRDYDGLHVQFQGDRLQGLFHVPVGDRSAIVAQAVRAAVGLQSSFLKTLPLHVPAIKGLGLAIGIDVGETLATKLGTRGDRDRICIGEPVDAAATIQQRHAGGVIALSERAYLALPEAMQLHFTEDADSGDWIAGGLSIEKLERTEKASLYADGTVGVHTTMAGAFVTSVKEGGRETNPARSFAS